MIPLIVVAVLLFAWAVIATAVAIGVTIVRDATIDRALLCEGDNRELRDRLQSNNLSEYHAARAVAMNAPAPAAPVTYRYDETGLIRDVADVTEPAE